MRPLVVLLLVLVAGLALSDNCSAAKLSDKLHVEFSERFRLITWDNAISLDDDSDAGVAFTRHRTSLGARWLPLPECEFGLKFTNEFRYYAVPQNVDFDLNEVFVDNLYLKAIQPWRLPVTVTLGRQNMILGEGFIVLDGGPLDGSRSIYFNAVRVDWQITAEQTITGFYMYQKPTDKLLPNIDDVRQQLIEQPEEGYGLYFDGSVNQVGFDAYIVHKNGEDNGFTHPDQATTTVGSRVRLSPHREITVAVEAGHQFGDRAGHDRTAWGGYGRLVWKPQWATNKWYAPNSVIAGLILLSGDDPWTEDYEGWDPMFARWPKWSESYIYTQLREVGVAYWTNLHSIHGRLTFELDSSATLRLDYHHLTAPEPAPGVARGHVRGNLAIGKLTYRFGKFWTGHILWEFFNPGDFYDAGADNYSWIRAELMFRI